MSEDELQPVDPKLAYIYLCGLGWYIVAGIVAIVVTAIYVNRWVPVLIGVALAVFVISYAVIGVRQVKYIGYAVREHDLLIQRGIMFRSTTVVPFGRMQFVDVAAGPVSRLLGLAEIQLHTASASTDATIPGLPVAEAHRLRELLAQRGETNLAGL